jgi:exosortase/archaeosortase family protein
VLTATANWPADNVRLIRFVLRGVLISLGLFGLVRLGWTEAHVVLPFTLAEAALAIRLFGIPALPIDVTLACSGADALSLCLGAVLAYPAAWRRRVTGAAGATGLILTLNILRIGTLGRVARSPFWFAALHLYLWPAAITLAIGAYVLIWMRMSDAAPRAAAPALDSAPNRQRRFIALAGFFLLAFVAAAPLYLNNTVVIAVAAFVARTAAAVLGLAGIPAHAAANTLWIRHGGFVVTEECISTPLIPVYLAGVAAFAPNWTQRSLGIAAAAPIFVLLGVLRLLVVALPSSVAAQSFFIHAFYQLLAGALFVMAAAYWRHRDKTAVACGACGVAVGALFIAIAGPAYLRLIALAARPPVIDSQGAIAFLPVFQIALYFALWTAAFVNAGWKRFAAGLALLVTSQVLGLATLDALLTHSGMTMAVRDVRGWALAAPVLIFAAMVSRDRTRR